MLTRCEPLWTEDGSGSSSSSSGSGGGGGGSGNADGLWKGKASK
jgi:hypothetical protein